MHEDFEKKMEDFEDFAIKIEGVSKLFPTVDLKGKKSFVPALLDVSLCVKSGSVTIVGGANGSGKSVLMSLIAGLSKPTRGKIWTKSKAGLVFQDAATQILGDTPLEDVLVGVKNLKIKNEKDVAENALKSVRLFEKSQMPAEFLSGGEKRRLAVASILAMGREIVIFDEPYANLDYPGVVDVNHLVEELHESKKTVVILTHELEKCLALCDHFVILSGGKIVFDGFPQDALLLEMEKWAIRNPLFSYKSISDLVWR